MERITIYAHHREAAIKQLSKLNRIAETIGKEFTFLILDTKPEIVKRKGKEIVIPQIQIIFSEDLLQLDGGALIASIELLGEGQAVVSKIGDYEGEIPERFYTTGAHVCDHCGQRRFRNRSFIVKTPEDELIQVGSTCMKKYAGISATSILRIFQIFESLSGFSNLESDFSWIPQGYGVEHMARLSYAVIRAEGGYVKKSDYDKTPTIGVLIEATEKSGTTGTWYGVYQDMAMSFDFDGYMEWVKAQPNGDYMNNVKSLVEIEHTPSFKSLGVLASSVWLYYKSQLEAKTSDVLNEHHPDANVKDRVTFDAKVLRSRTSEGMYGTTWIYTFQSVEGRIYTWFSSRRVDEVEDALGDDCVVSVTGSIKKFDEYRGTKQTVLTRCKVASQ